MKWRVACVSDVGDLVVHRGGTFAAKAADLVPLVRSAPAVVRSLTNAGQQKPFPGLDLSLADRKVRDADQETSTCRLGNDGCWFGFGSSNLDPFDIYFSLSCR